MVIAHSETFFGLKFIGGMAAVQIFFIISGFYMTMILNKKYVGKGSYKLFISNRLLRLFPSYLIVLILTIIASISSYIIFGKWLKLDLWITNISIIDIKTYSILILTNLFLIGQDIIMFTGIDKLNGSIYFINNFRESNIQTWNFLLLPQAWSIGLELTFYMVAPFVVRKSIQYIILFIFTSILLRAFIYFYVGWAHDPWTYRFFPTELALFLFGALSYKLYEKLSVQKIKSEYMIVPVVYFIILICYQFIPITPHIKNWFVYGVSIPVLSILFLLTKNIKIDNFIGELSYPIYLVHVLAITFSSKFISQEYKAEISILISIICAIFLVKFIEEPIDKLRQNRLTHQLK